MKDMYFEVTYSAVSEINDDWWKDVISIFIKPGMDFEIRVFNGDKEIISKALKYGDIDDESSSLWETSIRGEVTEEFTSDLLSYEKSDPRVWTEFFTIFLGDRNFQSSHNGNGIYIKTMTEEEGRRLLEILEPIKQCFSISLGG